MNVSDLTKRGVPSIFGGPQTESVITAEALVGSGQAAAGHTGFVPRGTALYNDSGTYKVVTSGSACDAIAADDIDTSDGAVEAVVFLKGGFGDAFIQGGADFDVENVRAYARQRGIIFHKVFED